jgi:hypothetical protein
MNSDTSIEGVRIKLAAAWTSILLIFAYVDIFGFYRADMRAEIEAGKVSAFKIGQGFLLGTTVYVAIASLMVFGSIVLRTRINQVANLVLAVLYALTIVVAMIGEWHYFVLGSVLELALLAEVGNLAWKWRRSSSAIAREK